MKNLMLLRHGKSDWNAVYDSDHERPLASRGSAAARSVGRFLAKLDREPDLILTSSAIRAAKTVQLAAKAGRWQCPLVSSPDLYDTNPERAMSLVQSQDNRVERLMLVGHNPTWEVLASIISGGSQFRIPTGGLVNIRFTVSRWREIREGTGVLTWFVTPKLLKRMGLT